MQQIYHTKNELFEVEFYQDKECIKPFDFTNAENLYIELKDGDVTPLLILPMASYYVPYIPKQFENINYGYKNIFTLNDITPNLSKYIPEDNAVLFLSEEDRELYDCYPVGTSRVYNEKFELPIESSGCGDPDCSCEYPYTKITIFLPYGTQSELQKAKEVAKELMEKYGVEEVNLCVLHCFIKYDVLHYEILNIDESDYFSKTPEEAFEYIQNTLDCDDYDFVEKYTKEYDDEFRKDFEEKKALFFKSLPFNKIITTNSTGILEPQNTERLQVIDCKEIFEEYLKESN